MNSWNDERIERAKKLWFEGVSAAEIANDLACGITRSAVLGKLDRLKLLKGGGRPITPTRLSHPKLPRLAKSRPMSRPKPTIARSTTSGRPRVLLAPPPDARPGEDGAPLVDEQLLRGDAWAALPGTTPIALTDIDLRGQCRWPIGDPREATFGFCGQSVQGEKGYCPVHQRRAYAASRGASFVSPHIIPAGPFP